VPPLSYPWTYSGLLHDPTSLAPCSQCHLYPISHSPLATRATPILPHSPFPLKPEILSIHTPLTSVFFHSFSQFPHLSCLYLSLAHYLSLLSPLASTRIPLSPLLTLSKFSVFSSPQTHSFSNFFNSLFSPCTSRFPVPDSPINMTYFC